jgi:hypothetical protein
MAIKILSATRAPAGWYTLVNGIRSPQREWAIVQDESGYIWTDTYCKDNDRRVPDSMMRGYVGRDWERPPEKTL